MFMKDEDFPFTPFTQILCLKVYKKVLDPKTLIFRFNLEKKSYLSQTCHLYMDFPFYGKECLRETDTLSICLDLCRQRNGISHFGWFCVCPAVYNIL